MNIRINLDFNELLEFAEKEEAKLRQAIKEAIDEVNTEEIYHRKYDQSGLRVRSGVLRSNLVTTKTDNSITISIALPYAEIHDQGGYNGRNHTAYQIPRYYFTMTLQETSEVTFQKIKERLSK